MVLFSFQCWVVFSLILERVSNDQKVVFFIYVQSMGIFSNIPVIKMIITEPMVRNFMLL